MNDKKVLRSLVMITQIGISMMVPLFLCAGIGYWINGQFGIVAAFAILLCLGAGAAFRNLFVLTKTFYAKDIQKEAKQKEYMENLKAYHEKHPDEDFSDVMEGKKKRYPDPKGPTRS